jgi:secretion/DNA translocation related TadE-like protein
MRLGEYSAEARVMDSAGNSGRRACVRPTRTLMGSRVWGIREGEEGSGAMLALGIGASFLILTFFLIPLLGGFVVHQRAQGLADVAALAVADAASGRLPGFPCSLAEELVLSRPYRLKECRVDGLISRVVLEASFGPFELTARARAGPRGAS